MSTNCLVATSNVKLYTGITSTGYDSLIESYVPMILDDIVNYTQNSFVNSTMYWYDDQITFTSNAIERNNTSVDLSYYWRQGNIVRVLGSIFNDGFYSVSSAVTSSSLGLNEILTTESSGNGKLIKLFKVQYPNDIPLIASRMIKHLTLTLDNPNITSESLGDHSISYTAVGSNSYPESIIKGLDKYRKIRMV